MSAASTASTPELLARVRDWITQDPDADTRAELDALAASAEAGDAGAIAGLEDRFSGRLAFGTAGLRGEVAGGPNRMNRVVVSQTTAGLAKFLLGRAGEGGEVSAVIGYDGRTKSDVFARDTAQILAGYGVAVTLLPRALPTPVLAYAVRHLRASAGVMITASHNPPQDNGYKLYLGDADGGSQIVPPADRAVFTAIDEVVATLRVDQLERSDDYTVADESILDAYVRRTAGELGVPAVPVRWVYTPMHGVGWETVSRVITEVGITPPLLVTEQIDPDPTFPTVAFPNPEEPGALDLAYATATRTGAELILANDPDADRLAAAVPDGSGWRALTGNELGLILGWGIAQRMQREGRTGNFAASIVSSPGLRVMAERLGFGYQETLTGFKWISRVPHLAFGFEEALGYLVDPWKVRDKDGISALLAALEGVMGLRAAGSTLSEFQDSFDATFGNFASAQLSVRVAQLDRLTEGMRRLRSDPPTEIGGIAVLSMDDLAAGSESLPPSDVLRFQLDEGARVIVRPSGTEPKLKVYLDVSSEDGSIVDRRTHGRLTLARLREGAAKLL